MMVFRSLLVVASMAVLSACVLAGETVIRPIYGPGCTDKVAKHIKGVDWAAARIITVRIRQDEFEPMVIVMRQNSPYIFRIENRDDYEHFFMANNFFRSVAIASISTPKKISKASCINGVRIGALETVELRLVAVRDGRYEYMDKIFPITSLGSMTGIISVDLPLKYFSSLAETANNKKSTPGSAVKGGATAVKPANQASPNANPFDMVSPANQAPPTANPFDTVKPTEQAPPTANPFDTVKPTEQAPPTANPFDVIKPTKQASPGTSLPDEAQPLKPRSKNLNPFDTVKPKKSSIPSSALSAGSVPDPFDSTKPVLHNIKIPNPFPDMGPMTSGKTGPHTPVSRPKQEKSDTLGTGTPASVIPVIGGNNQVVPPPPSKGTSAKPKPDLKARIRTRIKSFFGSLFGN